MTGAARRDQDHQRAFQEYTGALERWQQDRENVRRHAFDEGWKSAVRRNYNNGPATDQGHAAAREAVAAFEKANREPRFVEPESRMAGWFRKVKVGA